MNFYIFFVYINLEETIILLYFIKNDCQGTSVKCFIIQFACILARDFLFSFSVRIKPANMCSFRALTAYRLTIFKWSFYK